MRHNFKKLIGVEQEIEFLGHNYLAGTLYALKVITSGPARRMTKTLTATGRRPFKHPHPSVPLVFGCSVGLDPSKPWECLTIMPMAKFLIAAALFSLPDWEQILCIRQYPLHHIAAVSSSQQKWTLQALCSYALMLWPGNP